MFKRRIGKDPHADGKETANLAGCPDIWELTDGRFAIIGLDMTERLRSQLPSTASCGVDERIIVLDRRILVDAKPDIPAE